MIHVCGRMRFAAEARERFAGIRLISPARVYSNDMAGMALARAEDHTHSDPIPLEDLVPETPVGILNFDFGEERVETLAAGVFIFGQPDLEQTPEAKSVAHTQRDVTVPALVRLARGRRERISEAVEIHLGKVKS